jgi:Ca-activated chloride channel family protein
MNPLPSNPGQLLAGLLMLLTSLTAASANSDTKTDASLSPYFFIEGGDSGVDRLPLKETRAEVKLNGYLASVRLTQLYRNEGNQAINASYIFPGSTRAAVNGMTMTIGERRIVARIKEKQAAKQEFDTAQKAGKSASLLSQKRPNVFSMQVANILPGDEVKVTLDYSEILSAENGIYEFVYPGVVGPRYAGDAALSNGEIRWVQNPYLLQQGSNAPVIYDLHIEMHAPLPISSLNSPSHTLISSWQGKQEVSLSLKDVTNAGNRDFILRFRLQDQQIMTGLMQFESENENYFLLVSEPPERVLPEQIPARDYFFIVDVSGSMHGFPLDTARNLMDELFRTLKPSDRFNVLFFAGGSEVLSSQPLAATPANISRAKVMLQRQKGGGGTELYAALKRVFTMSSDEDTSRNIVLITDGYISAEDRVFQLIDQQLHRNNLFAFGIGSSVNRHLIEGVARAGRAEPFVVNAGSEAAHQTSLFNDYISAPALTNIRLQAEGVELYDMEPLQIPDMLAQRPIMVIGKYRNASDDARLTLMGTGGQGEQQWAFRLKEAAMADDNLPQLWARKRLKRLYIIPHANEQLKRERILELGLKYSLLTRHTSFVAVDETIRNHSATAHDVKQPLPLPKGVSNLAVGRPMPEPEFLWMLIATLASGVIGWLRRERYATTY